MPSLASVEAESCITVLIAQCNAGQGEEPAAVAAVKGVAADAVADYLRSADVYQVKLMPLHPAPLGNALLMLVMVSV